MSVSEQNTRVMITIPKDIYIRLAKLAKMEKRSLSNLCVKILADYLERKEGGAS